MHPPPYERITWYHEKADTELFQRVTDQSSRLQTFFNVNVDEKVSYFIKCCLI